LAPLLVAFGCDQILGADFDAQRRPRSDAGLDAREPEDSSALPDVRDSDASDATPALDGDARTDGEPDVSQPEADGGNDGGDDADAGDGTDGGDGGDGGTVTFASVAGVHFHHPVYIASDLGVRDAVRSAGANGVHFSIPWRTGFYTSNDSCSQPGCPNPTCYGGSCPDCKAGALCYWRPSSVEICRNFGYHELECWVRGALDFWTREGAIPPASVLATLLVHSGSLGDWRLGPQHIAELQTEPGDMTDARVLAAYREFYDEVIEILQGVLYSSSVRDWTLSVGNHVNTYLCDGAHWTAFRGFYEQALTHAREPSRRPEQPLRIGTSTTFRAFGCHGVWDVDTDAESVAAPHLRALNARSDVLLLEYFGVDSPGDLSLAALDPREAEHDVERMLAFRDSVRPGGEPLPLLLADVAYPTNGALHDVASTYDERFSHFGAGYSSGEAAQRLFAESLFGALEGRRDFAGLYWWALFDLPGYEQGPCRDYVVDEIGADYSLPKAFLCSAGLIPPIGLPARSVSGVFEAWAARFTR
jgi:hypothetical protein